MGVPLWDFGLRIVILYAVVMIALRIMGKREIGQLSVFDFVVSVMLAELSTLPMENTNIPITRSLIAIGALVVLQLLVAILQLKSHRFRHWVDGEPTVLIQHGLINDREMKRTRYTLHDLLTQVREKGFSTLSDVEFAVLETSGQLSVFPKPEAKPITPGDLQLQVTSGGIPLPLIVDGKTVEKSLVLIEKDASWLQQVVEQRGYKTIENVFYAFIDAAGNIYLDERDK